MSHVNMLVFPAVVLPLAGRLQLEMAQVLGLSFGMYLLFGLSALPWGLLADRFSAKPLLQIYYIGAGCSGLAAALWIDAPARFAVALSFLGLFAGIYHPAGLGLISKTSLRVSYAMGLNGMFGNLGVAAGPLIAGLVNWLWGPRAAYLVLGGLNLCGFVLMLSLPLPGTSRSTPAKAHKENSQWGIFGILLVAMMLGGVAYRGATVILPTYFELKNQALFQWLQTLSSGRFSPNLAATLATSMIFIAGMLGQYIGGRTAERVKPVHGYLTFHAITVPMAFLMAVTTDWRLLTVALVYFFFLLGMQPIENTLVANLTPKRLHSSAYGTKFVLTFGVGALAVKMVGRIQTGHGIEAVFPALGLIAVLVVATIVLLLVRMRRKI